MTNIQKSIVGIGAVLMLGVTGWILYATVFQGYLSLDENRSIDSTVELGEIDTGNASVASTTSQLLYLIEEEKLAHDVYAKLYERYGANVFGTILKSEATHQSEVLALLKARGIDDPRSTIAGVFTNDDLQSLYNKLVAQGNQSVTEAYKVGVAIEELDIVDISKQLETAADTDVITVLEKLRRGSENHLRAFNRRLNK